METEILLFLQNQRQEWLTPILTGITHLGDYGFIWIIIGLYCCLRRTYKIVGIKILGALAYVLLLNNIILKNLINRERPFHAIEDLILLTAEPYGLSFPSGHTAGALAAGYIFYKYFPGKYSVILIGLGLVMGFSRLYVGAHYPSDVLGGIIIGLLCGYFSDLTVNKFIKLAKKTGSK